MQRVRASELLDGSLDDAAVLAGNLRDLRRVNRWLGGVAISDAAIDAISTERHDLTLLDVGTGGADIPDELVRRAQRRGRRVRAVGLDSRPEILAAARTWLEESGTSGEIELRLGDGLALPYPDRSFDVVHASLVTHHLEPGQATAFLAEMARVARLGIVVNDLVRSRPAWLAAWLLTRVATRNRYTRHDAPLSVRRAYRVMELEALLVHAGLVSVRVVRGPAGHRVAIAAVHRSRPRPMPDEPLMDATGP